ncbi:MAG TPA: pyridoxal-phosphate dependent enzyme [Gemmatimonadaceae bacterium]|nr:pyridoxal-phosphate dependent enzyme [Gemmatimonadaceae bacterium]
MTEGARDRPIPLVRRYPALASIPRVPLGEYPTPVESLRFPGLDSPLWIKRDDLASSTLGGNKVRALEYLLAGVAPGDLLLTGGGEGSTHVLATALHASRLQARLHAVRWRHEMHAVSEDVASRSRSECLVVETSATPLGGILRTLARRMTLRARWIPFGGTSPLGILGHVNGALELADQVDAGELPPPARIVVPLGTGGTAAGLALGFAAAGMRTQVIGARVVPRIATGHARVILRARATARWVRKKTGVVLPRVRSNAVRVVHDAYAGAYGRVSPLGREAAAAMERASGMRLDATYSAKAFAIALRVARAEDGVTVFWSTFDARWLR